MGSRDIHAEKFRQFKQDAEREENSTPLRIEAYFYSLFLLIESVVAASGIHINKHQHMRRELEANPDIFGDRTREVWEGFQEIENRIRPGQVYGSAVNGKNLARVQEIFRTIEEIVSERESA